MSDPITDAELTEWERLCQEATPGWKVCVDDDDLRHVVGVVCHASDAPEGGEHCAILFTEGEAEHRMKDLDFAVAARTALPRLLEEVKRLRRESFERAARLHDEAAANLRFRANKTREEWTPDLSSEDRRANAADARRDEERAGWHRDCAEWLRAQNRT